MQKKDMHAAAKYNLFIKWGIRTSVYGLMEFGKRNFTERDVRSFRILKTDQFFWERRKRKQMISLLCTCTYRAAFVMPEETMCAVLTALLVVARAQCNKGIRVHLSRCLW